MFRRTIALALLSTLALPIASASTLEGPQDDPRPVVKTPEDAPQKGDKKQRAEKRKEAQKKRAERKGDAKRGERKKGEAKKGEGRPSRKELLKRFDKDGDGKLSEAERKTARAAVEARREAARKARAKKRAQEKSEKKPGEKKPGEKKGDETKGSGEDAKGGTEGKDHKGHGHRKGRRRAKRSGDGGKVKNTPRRRGGLR